MPQLPQNYAGICHPFVEARAELVSYLKTQLIGPCGGESETLQDFPHKRYLMGILFPVAATIDTFDEDNDEGDDELSTSALSNDFKPSSMGISFVIDSNSKVKIELFSGKYKNIDKSKDWIREPLYFETTCEFNKSNKKNVDVFNENGRLNIICRPYKNSYVVTVALSNNAKSTEQLKPEQCLYQTKIKVTVVSGKLQKYPSSDRFRLDEEQRELALLYRKRLPWAVGHGTAVTWAEDSSSSPNVFETNAMPHHEVKDFTTDLDIETYPELTNDLLSIAKIANPELASEDELLQGFEKLIRCYKHWIHTLKQEELKHYQLAKDAILERLTTAANRMQKGIELLKHSTSAMRAFRLANKAMLIQMIHSSDAFSGKRKQYNWGFKKPDYFTADIIENYKWRPFQLAFQLLVLESIIPDSKTGEFSKHHDEVDLLWFPTGGGKTEAYLAVAAWEMIYRRLTQGTKGGGTAVIKRYTLRLLTSQQFQRAGSLICALEHLRKQLPELGEEEFSLGLWVGKNTSPNKYAEAFQEYQKVRNEPHPENKFQLQVCPWCGTEIIPRSFKDDEKAYGVRASDDHFEFFCPSSACEFHRSLPIQVVDQALYKKPPTLLIGTIDKFARLTWIAESSAFFGKRKGKHPPSLIIQDELHLISGPLGTIAGIYEAGFDAIIRSLGKPAKILAATATIRAAEQQSIRLFGRSINVFPPAGTDEADSFFSKEEKNKPGRLFVGIMPSGHTGQTALVQTAAAALQAPYELGFKEETLDSYWTMPIYHNSRRELGKTMSLARDDIPARMRVISEEARDIQEVEELSANIKGSRIPEVLANLSKSVPEAIDVLPCTNMISVGVDISRLSMMIIAGQPKATAEYIQASSRVGRNKKKPPGIVITLYSATKPRDRSHYETFKSYHQALYRYVEPTSVTPWAQPALERALHGALIAMVRMTELYNSNESAKDFDSTHQEFIAHYAIFRRRVADAMQGNSDSEQQAVITYLESLLDTWMNKTASGKPLRYEGSKQFNRLIQSFDNAHKNSVNDAWLTLNSMRNVDTQTVLNVRGEDE